MSKDYTLTKVKVQHFRRLRDADAVLDGLNLVVGGKQRREEQPATGDTLWRERRDGATRY